MGKITASAILRRLGTHSRKNRIYFAFRELGRVIRTIYLLQYISDVDLRRTVYQATNKNEEFHYFLNWAFFGRERVISENQRHEQQKIIKYNHLVANLLILHNVEHMTRILREMREEGFEITPEILARTSPYRTRHWNRFGDFRLDLTRQVAPLSFDTHILV